MRRSALENKYLKNKKAETKRLYKKQKNYCSKLYRKERKQYFANLSLNKSAYTFQKIERLTSSSQAFR